MFVTLWLKKNKKKRLRAKIPKGVVFGSYRIGKKYTSEINLATRLSWHSPSDP